MHTFFLNKFKLANPMIYPSLWMSDKDQAQLNALKNTYDRSKILLCWWHVLHAWYGHFHVHSHQELWKKLKEWVRISDDAEFQIQWAEIQKLSPPSFSLYLNENWMSCMEYWSAIFRINRNISEVSDTNMLIEA